MKIVCDGGFDGKLSADGKTIAGTWTQGQTTSPLTLELATAQTAWQMPAAPEKPKPMAANADPSFESGRRQTHRCPRHPEQGIRHAGTPFPVTNESVADMITLALVCTYSRWPACLHGR